MNFIRRYWFGISTGLIIFLCSLLFILVLIAPRQDTLKRGFIPCTEAMAEQIMTCDENKIVCVLNAVLVNSWCDVKVIYQGVEDWINGKQETPWNNYIFIPELPEDENFNNEARAEYLKNNPDMATEMKQLKKLSEDLEYEEKLQLQPKPEDLPQQRDIAE